MSDESPLLIKLSHPASPGKSRDSKEVPVGKENRRGKQGRKRQPDFSGLSTADEKSIREEMKNEQNSGKVLDITI